MRAHLLILLSLNYLGAFAVEDEHDRSSDVSGKGNGLGEHFNWVSLSEGLKLSNEQKKPLMLIIHKSWCGACRALKPKFANSQQIKQLSSKFIMVNTMDDDEPTGDIYQPDGGYVPRILFFDNSGQLLRKIYNENGNPQYKYYYYDDEGIVAAMGRALQKYGSKGAQEKSEL